MKKVICFILALLLLALAGCDTVLNQPPQQSAESSGDESEISVPEDTADVFLPEPAEGIWFVSTEEELKGLDLDSFNGVPTICITEDFEFTSDHVIDRPVILYYGAESVRAQQKGILISTRQSGEIKIYSTVASLFEKGVLTVDAPECAVTWESDVLPEKKAVSYYCNALSFNGETLSDLGGKGNATVTDIKIDGFEDGTFSLRGNVITLGYPLVMGDDDVESAALLIQTDGKYDSKTYNLKENHTLTVTDRDGSTRTYLLIPQRLSYGLPVMEINTNLHAPILSKNEYVKGSLTIDGTVYPMQIKGRGNASWNSFPKKSYRIKLDKGESLFGLPQNRDWVLTGNYADKSLIRNAIAHDIAASLDGLDFTSTHVSVNLYLNGKYMGVYTFADKIEEGAGRLDFTDLPDDEPNTFGGLDIGFLIEIGWDFDGENDYNKDYFDSQKVLRIYVKEPKSDRANTPEFTYTKQYILAMEHAIIMNDGWEDFIDLDSWVDWFIATELTFNMESAYYRSCYMWKRDGGKLMMGPVWDFDMAFGNHLGDLYDYNGFCTTESTYQYIRINWMNYLIKYDTFNDAVKARWNEKKDELLATALESVDRHSSSLEGSQQQNFKVWNIMTQQIGMGKVNPKEYDTYEKQVQYVRDFINTRFEYLDERINNEF